MDMLWSGWGDPAKAAPLPETVTGLLRDLLGVRPRTAEPIALADIAVPEPGLEPAALQDLVAAAGGEEHVRTDAETRVRHTRGKSTPDLLRIRDGEVDADLPAAVVLPADHDEVVAVLRVCAGHGLPVVPFGGGTSVVGGLAPAGRRPFVALDLRRMDRMLALDPVSRTATLQPGLRAPQAEALLAEHGFTLGHFPQSYEWASIGGFAATRSSGQASAGYGRFDEMVLGLTVATPEGTLDTGRAPRSAAGPDLRQLLLGSEGAFGVITSVTVRIRPGDGRHVRDWLHVDDHCHGVELVRTRGRPGETYNIGGGTELSNKELTALLLDACGAGRDRVEHVEDRKGHDLRYSVDWTKARTELGYRPRRDFTTGLAETVAWYRENRAWWEPLTRRAGEEAGG
ncbi:FAD-binding protein [Streptomyces nigra]